MDQKYKRHLDNIVSTPISKAGLSLTFSQLCCRTLDLKTLLSKDLVIDMIIMDIITA